MVFPDVTTLAVIGCGAVAERVHLPALARSREVATSVLADTDLARARRLANQFAVPRAVADYRDVIGRVDAAIIGTPHQVHASIAIELLEAGVHVLVEKPMALAPADCLRMNAAAAASGAVLAVGLLRRCAPALRWVKEAIDSGLAGRVASFDLREGSVYRWPVTSASMFRAEGGGVLADAGAHVLDLVTWWFGDCRSMTYRDDARGGVEANCLIELEMKSGARGRIELSRTRDLANACVIRGERAIVEVGTKTDSTVSVTWNRGGTLCGRPLFGGQPPPSTLVDLFVPQLEQFVRAVRSGERPVVSGTDALPSIELMAACYATRQPWIMPWDVEEYAARVSDAEEVQEIAG
jgi:predicted dehydrogenase